MIDRLAILTPEYPADGRTDGGIGAQYRALAAALAAHGTDVHAFMIGTAASRHEIRDRVIVHSVAIDGLVRSPWLVARAIAARRSIRFHGPFDAILAADWKGDAALLPESDRRLLVTHLHTCGAVYDEISCSRDDPELRRWRHRLLLYAERRQGEHSAGILSCSHALLYRTRHHWDISRKPSAVAPNVIDYDRVRRLGSQEDALGSVRLVPGAPTIVMPGRLETRKGVGVLLEAMRYVSRDYPDARLLLAGAPGILNGRPVSECVAEEIHSRGARIQILGLLAQEALFPLLKRADVVVTPSLWEAFGISTLEAMALGCRVVATSGSGFAEFCTNGVDSLLVRPDHPEELAGGILRALREDASMLGRAAERTARNFDASRRAGEFLLRLHEILAFPRSLAAVVPSPDRTEANV